MYVIHQSWSVFSVCDKHQALLLCCSGTSSSSLPWVREASQQCFTPDRQSGLFPSLIFSFNGATLHRAPSPRRGPGCTLFLISHASVGADRHSCVSTCLLAGRGVPTYGGCTEWWQSQLLDPWLGTVWICFYMRKMDLNSSGVMEYWWQFNGLFPSLKMYHWPSIFELPVADEQPWHIFFF